MYVILNVSEKGRVLQMTTHKKKPLFKPMTMWSEYEHQVFGNIVIGVSFGIFMLIYFLGVTA